MLADVSPLHPTERHASLKKIRRLALSTCPSPLVRKLPYKYIALKKNEIRLLRLYPGCGDAPLCCSLHVVNLDAYDDVTSTSSVEGFERYNAISYVWGSRRHKVKITCDGRTVRVTSSLADALRRLRDPSTTQILWADALCVNQKDNNERSTQVKIMGLIFWKAHRVQIWLGEDDDQPEARRARHAAELIKECARLYSSSTISARDLHSERIFDDPHDWSRPGRVAVVLLFDRPWFQRVWCVQELGLASAATFNCGTSQFTAKEVGQFFKLLNYSENGNIFLSKIECQMLEIARGYHDSTRGAHRIEIGSDPGSAENFFDVLKRARGLRCTDPRDTVYAFLGHPTAFKKHILDVDPYYHNPSNYYAGRSTIISPNYEKANTVSIVCTQLAINAIQHFEIGLEIFKHVAHNQETINADIPSWVPRWDITGQDPYFNGFWNMYSASGTLKPTLLSVHSPVGSIWNSKLSLIAMRLGTIGFVHPGPAVNSIWKLAESLFPGKRFAGSSTPSAGLQIAPHLMPEQCRLDDRWSDFAMALTAGLPREDTPMQDYDGRQTTRQAYGLQGFLDYHGREPPQDQIAVDDRLVEMFHTCSKEMGTTKIFYITNDGRYGLAPTIAQEGDEIWLPLGAKMPCVFRPVNERVFKLVGQTYLHGVMKGEAVKQKSKRDFLSVILS
ncbi:uncharacterized protein EKO05_0010863 [Ascochyta rabiei]|uniref:uncharacterized protein n=1 Tax=Didymella rabiei TaxID=5454 RepID=UPI0018FF40D4|nr:uncharacterized protein EKO05_0010863 [Ascochyta rabiei]UPX20635.1 hypothetical protein EKO05_0010863 [Ascochyta rabiei]